MAWGEWMIVELSVEDQLRLEGQARAALSHDDPNQVAQLCASLIRQNAYQSKLIQQATGHIGQLEMEQFLAGAKPKPWWRRLLRRQ
jgi:hypothetical protein